MSFLSTTENVGFSGIPQMSEASCATQYKMAVEGVPAVCSEVNSFMNDGSSDEHYMNDNYFHTKFKIDPNEIYTFHDSDVIASEITVSHTEDNYIFSDNTEIKSKQLDTQDIDTVDSLPLNGIKVEIEEKFTPTSNGNYKTVSKASTDFKPTNTKVQKAHSQVKETNVTSVNNTTKSNTHSSKVTSASSTQGNTKTSISKDNKNSVIPNMKSLGSETFLDVFKREQGLVKPSEPVVTVKTEPNVTPVKAPTSVKKTPSAKAPSTSKPRRGRGPTLHEALQRIPRRAQPVLNRVWHAPGDELFDCGPLTESRPVLRPDNSSSEDDDQLPNFGENMGCVEETSAESRGARLALRRAALRRQVAQASSALKLSQDHKRHRMLASMIKKQVCSVGSSNRLPQVTLNHLLAMRGMTNVLSSQERRQLRTSGFSSNQTIPTLRCSADTCPEPALPCSSHCSSHITRARSQRLFASCSAVFAGGRRCEQALLPLGGDTPLCAEHAWKRDNYDKISRYVKPKKLVRKRAWPPSRRNKKRPVTKSRTTTLDSNQSLSELNVCSNSSTYDSSEDTGVGGLSESEFVVSNCELEVEQVPADDILDSEVLGQIPDEAFTEFFNQAEGGATFAESSELARALEAVLDERALDTLAESLPAPRNKIQMSSVGVEMSSGVSS